MQLSLSIPSYNQPAVQISVQPMDATMQDDTTQSLEQETSYPLSTVATPPNIAYSAFDSSNPYGIEQQSKDHFTSLSKRHDRTPRKRSVTGDDCILPFNTSFKRARIKMNDRPHATDSQQDDTNFYFNNTAFPTPSPTPVTQHPGRNQEQQHQLSHQHNIKDTSILNALRQMPNIIDSYDTLPIDMKTYLLFQLLKRSSTQSLKYLNSIIVSSFKRDFLATLPHELALQVIRNLDARSLCRAATVSKTWRSIVDGDKTTWRTLLDKDGFKEDDQSYVQSSTHNIHSKNRYSSNNNDHDNDMKLEQFDTSEPMDIDEYDRIHDEDDNDDNNTQTNNHDGNAGTSKGKKRCLSSIDNPYKNDYRKRYSLRSNWKRGNFKRISFPGHSSPNENVVTCLQFDDDKIISGVDDRVINIYETKTGRHISTLRGHEGGVWALQYIGNTLVSGSTDCTIRIWDIERAVCTHVFLGHTSTVRCLQIVMPTMVNGRLEPSHPLIITGSRDSTLRVWRLPDPRNDPPFDGNGVNPWYMHTLTGHSLPVRAITAHGNTLVSGSYDNMVCVWNLETGQLIHRMEGHQQKVYAVVIDPDRKRCMSGGMDGTIRVWDLTTGQCLQSLDGHTILVGLLGLTKNYLVSAAADGTLRVWSPENGICQNVLSDHKAPVTCFQHDEHKVISGSEGGLKMWDIKTGRHIKDLITDVDWVWRVAFNKHRCVAAVSKNHVTSFEVLDFSGDGLQEQSD
ncbi:WD40-repeat-containing domain protein [Halteromyces radiatus]|uniref:WD40-repeat-containing domain protein n=1 Tax=Halteromyces radiatus TaxID=101107 RepID=UPI00221E9314|nr:WD40-repeat-containing domain protein [Halteromyces radiatus]KAI8089360.1 WD40-repeat-containing domain protein [Halteromyces radiatus]